MLSVMTFVAPCTVKHAGWKKKEVVDEIRHEDRDDDLFAMD